MAFFFNPQKNDHLNDHMSAKSSPKLKIKFLQTIFLEKYTKFMNIRFLSNKYIIDTRITNWDQLRIVYIFDNFGNLINKISIEYDSYDDKDFVHYSSQSIIVFSNKEKKLKYFDLDGDQFQET